MAADSLLLKVAEHLTVFTGSWLITVPLLLVGIWLAWRFIEYLYQRRLANVDWDELAEVSPQRR